MPCVLHAGDIVNMKELGVWEPLMVKTQTFKTAIEAGGLMVVTGGGGGFHFTCSDINTHCMMFPVFGLVACCKHS